MLLRRRLELPLVIYIESRTLVYDPSPTSRLHKVARALTAKFMAFWSTGFSCASTDLLKLIWLRSQCLRRTTSIYPGA